MLQKTLQVKLKSGLHARPATEFVKIANTFHSEILVGKGTQEANAKSILSLLSLGVAHDQSITIKVNGPDEQEALTALERLVASEEI
jgi:catabolite repression HPr-like protein